MSKRKNLEAEMRDALIREVEKKARFSEDQIDNFYRQIKYKDFEKAATYIPLEYQHLPLCFSEEPRWCDWPLMHYAAREGDRDVIEYLLDQKADIEFTSVKVKSSILILACLFFS